MTQVLTAAQADAAWGAGCKPLGVKAVKFDGLLFNWINHPGAIAAFHALGNIFTKHGYEVRAEDTGTYNCRNIKGTNIPSRHGKPTAIDVNWESNPAGSRLITDIPRAIIDEATSMRTNSGEQVWRWGGDWDTRPETSHSFYDAMHFELIAHPDDLETGIKEIEMKIPKPSWLPVSTLEYLVLNGIINQIPESETLDMWRTYVMLYRIHSAIEAGRGLRYGDLVNLSKPA